MVEPALLQAWLHARSLSRGVPLPVPDRGGLRVDTGLENELRRYVFPHAGEPVRTLAQSIRTPNVFLKVCAPAAELMSTLPSGWELRPPGFMMLCDGLMGGTAAVLPEGYGLNLSRDGAVMTAQVQTADGLLAASGRAVRHGGIVIYDQIETDGRHRRRGLARAVLRALENVAWRPYDRQILSATKDGFSLYSTLGWRLLSPYSTAVIPCRTPAPCPD